MLAFGCERVVERDEAGHHLRRLRAWSLLVRVRVRVRRVLLLPARGVFFLLVRRELLVGRGLLQFDGHCYVCRFCIRRFFFAFQQFASLPARLPACFRFPQWSPFSQWRRKTPILAAATTAARSRRSTRMRRATWALRTKRLYPCAPMTSPAWRPETASPRCVQSNSTLSPDTHPESSLQQTKEQRPRWAWAWA